MGGRSDSDAVYAAVGAAALAVAVPLLIVFIPLSIRCPLWIPAAIGAALIGGTGVYALLSVVLAIPRPRTRWERQFAPDLSVVAVDVLKKVELGWLIRVGFDNSGTADVPRALVNVVVPKDPVVRLLRSDERGNPLVLPESSVAETEDEWYWNGPVDFPGEVSRPLNFVVSIVPAKSGRFLLRASAKKSELGVRYDETFTVEITAEESP